MTVSELSSSSAPSIDTSGSNDPSFNFDVTPIRSVISEILTVSPSPAAKPHHFTFEFPATSSSSIASKDAPVSTVSRRFLPFDPFTPSDKVISTRQHLSTICFSPPKQSSSLDVTEFFAPPTENSPIPLSHCSHKAKGSTFGSTKELISFFERSLFFSHLSDNDTAHPRIAAFFENSEITWNGVITFGNIIPFSTAIQLAFESLNSNKDKKLIPKEYLGAYASALNKYAFEILSAKKASDDSKKDT